MNLEFNLNRELLDISNNFHKNIETDVNQTYLKLESKVIKSEPKLLFKSDTTELHANQNNYDDDKENIITNSSHFIKYVKEKNELVKKFECGFCGKDFQHQYALIRHIPIHSNARNFVCPNCGKAFRQLSTLSQHLAIHSQERPFVCEICDKSFNRSSSLISHRKTHSDNKLYSCEICFKGFHQKGNLRNHLYSHNNSRPYLCEFCNKGFNQMSNLVCHKRKVHADLFAASWQCQHCELKFSKRYLLRAHEFENHNIVTKKRNNIIKKSKKTTIKTIVNVDGIILPIIETVSMKIAKRSKQIPFGILHLLEGHPHLVRIFESDNQCILKRAQTEDIKLFTQNDKNITVAIVATIYQILKENGEPGWSVQSPKTTYKCLIKPEMITINDTDNEAVKFESEILEKIPDENIISVDELLKSQSDEHDDKLEMNEFNTLLNAITSEENDPNFGSITSSIFAENGIFLSDNF